MTDETSVVLLNILKLYPELHVIQSNLEWEDGTYVARYIQHLLDINRAGRVLLLASSNGNFRSRRRRRSSNASTSSTETNRLRSNSSNNSINGAISTLSNSRNSVANNINCSKAQHDLSKVLASRKPKPLSSNQNATWSSLKSPPLQQPIQPSSISNATWSSIPAAEKQAAGSLHDNRRCKQEPAKGQLQDIGEHPENEDIVHERWQRREQQQRRNQRRPIPISVWPTVLARLTKKATYPNYVPRKNSMNGVFYLIRHGPIIVEQNIRRHESYLKKQRRRQQRISGQRVGMKRRSSSFKKTIGNGSFDDEQGDIDDDLNDELDGLERRKRCKGDPALGGYKTLDEFLRYELGVESS